MEELRLTPNRFARRRVKTTQPTPAATSSRKMTSTITPAVFMVADQLTLSAACVSLSFLVAYLRGAHPSPNQTDTHNSRTGDDDGSLRYVNGHRKRIQEPRLMMRAPWSADIWVVCVVRWGHKNQYFPTSAWAKKEDFRVVCVSLVPQSSVYMCRAAQQRNERAKRLYRGSALLLDRRTNWAAGLRRWGLTQGVDEDPPKKRNLPRPKTIC